MRRNTGEHIAEPGERLYARPFTGGKKASQNRSCPAPVIASEEGPVTTAQCDVPIGPFGSTIVDFRPALQCPATTLEFSQGQKQRPMLRE